MGLRNDWNTLVGQKFINGNGSVTGDVVVVQHPRVGKPISSVKMWLTGW
jgi:hypothetical protein